MGGGVGEEKNLERSTIADAKAAVCLLCPRIFGGLCSICVTN